MEIKQIEQLLKAIKETDISAFEIEQDGTHIKIQRGAQYVMAPAERAMPREIHPAVGGSNGHAAAPVASAVSASEVPSNWIKVISPLVGTFSRKPSPDKEPFVTEGQLVKKGDTLCIVEAMKLMNEIEAEVAGRIEKVCLTDGQVVEFGETLLFINPSV